MSVVNVKGTHDIIGEEANAFNAIENLMKHIAELFAFHEVRPPVLEHSELFVRGVGESSDVVRKEMYTFLDKAERSVTLRPEFTAGIMRLLIQNKMLFTNELPVKTYYCGPVFRYERPQLGRYRQFNQFGVESVGNANPLNDVDVIVLAYTILQTLGLENVTIKINTLGDDESRNNYREALKEFFGKHIENMCPDCKSRYELNPLRILDCKVPEDQEIVKGAPKMHDFLSEAAKQRFAYVLKTLDDMEIKYEIDDTLVRGLDYYSETVFEFHYQSQNGNNYGAIGAGGHYDKLVGELGGPDMPGVGFSFGIERIYSVLKDDNLLPDDIKDSLNFYVMPIGQITQAYALEVATHIRLLGYSVDMCMDDTKMGNMFKRAEKKNARFAIIIGEDEIKNDKVILKDLVNKEQTDVQIKDLESVIMGLFDEEGEPEEHTCCGGHHENGGCCCHHDENEEEHECCCGHHGKKD